MRMETNLSVTIENFCFSEIVPARLTKTISLTNVQHFGHFANSIQVHNSLSCSHTHFNQWPLIG